MIPEEFFRRLEAHETLFLIGSGRKVFLKKDRSGIYILSTTDESFLSYGKEYQVHPSVDDRYVFFYDYMVKEGIRTLTFHTRTDRWEAEA